MYEAGLIDRVDRERRLQAVMDGVSQLDAQRLVLAVPTVDWSWTPKALNPVLRALFERIDLDAETFAPVGYRWTVPEWRAA